MFSSINKFLIFTLLLLFFYNISGLAICIEHAEHSKNHSVQADGSEKGYEKYITQDDNCQCALHFQINHILLPEETVIDLPFAQIAIVQNLQSKAITYSCLIDFFSSRAPPSFS